MTLAQRVDLRLAPSELALERREPVGLGDRVARDPIAFGDERGFGFGAACKLLPQCRRGRVDRLGPGGEGAAVVVDDAQVGMRRLELGAVSLQLALRGVEVAAQRVALGPERVQRGDGILDLPCLGGVVLVPVVLGRPQLSDLMEQPLEPRFRFHGAVCHGLAGLPLVLEGIGETRDRHALVGELAVRGDQLVGQRLFA